MLGFVDICSVPSLSSWMFLAAPPTNLKIVAQRWSRNTKFVGSSMWRAGFLTPAWRRYKEVLEDPFCGKRMKKSQSSSISSLTSKYINLWYIHLSGTYGTSSHYSSSILMHPAICMVDFGRLDFLGAPPQSSLRPGYRNRGLVCRGCRTWCSSHMPSETAGNSKSGRLTSLIIPKFTGFTGWHSLLESNWTKWRHLHGHTFIKPLSSTTWCRQKLTPSRLFRGLTVLHHFGFQIGQPHVDSCGYRCCANDSSWLDPQICPIFGGVCWFWCTRSMIVYPIGISSTRASTIKGQGANFRSIIWPKPDHWCWGETKLREVKSIPRYPAFYFEFVDDS